MKHDIRYDYYDNWMNRYKRRLSSGLSSGEIQKPFRNHKVSAKTLPFIFLFVWLFLAQVRDEVHLVDGKYHYEKPRKKL